MNLRVLFTLVASLALTTLSCAPTRSAEAPLEGAQREAAFRALATTINAEVAPYETFVDDTATNNSGPKNSHHDFGGAVMEVGKPLPAGDFVIQRRAVPQIPKVPRVDLIMSSGPSIGQKFTCNLITGPHPEWWSLAPECSGEQGPIDKNCVDRDICFPADDCGCRK